MKTYFFFILLALPIAAFAQTEENNIPESIYPLLDHSMKSTLVAKTKYENVEYFLINETGDEIGGQKLISIEDSNSPKIIANDTFLFPLNQFKLPKPVIQELADQYVQHEIQSTPSGIEKIQERFDKSPVPPDTWLSSDLKNAYQKAGIKFP